MPIPDQALSQLLSYKLGRIVCLAHSGSQEDHPSRRKLRVIDDLSQNGSGVLLCVGVLVGVCWRVGVCVLVCCVCCVVVCCCVLCVVVCCCVLLCVVVTGALLTKGADSSFAEAHRWFSSDPIHIEDEVKDQEDEVEDGREMKSAKRGS